LWAVNISSAVTNTLTQNKRQGTAPF